jgi:hypothetical protein
LHQKTTSNETNPNEQISVVQNLLEITIRYALKKKNEDKLFMNLDKHFICKTGSKLDLEKMIFYLVF